MRIKGGRARGAASHRLKTTPEKPGAIWNWNSRELGRGWKRSSSKTTPVVPVLVCWSC